MTKFKAGDKIRRIIGTGFPKGKSFHKMGDIVEFSHYDYDGGELIVDVKGLSGYSDKYELVTPAASIGFEVGKKYVLTSTQHRVEVLHSHGEEHWLKNEKGKTFVVHDRDFIYYEEYIPPPPEEWRIVYKDEFGNVTVGKTPFKSKSEAKASRYWTDHSSSFKTIRVDA